MYNGFMLKRSFAALILAFMPVGVLAEEASPITAPTTNEAPSAGLGPQTSAPAGGSNADAAALQPAGLSPIQSTTTDSAGLTAPANALQAPSIPSDQLQVLAGEADGPPQELGGEPEDNLWLWDSLAALVLLAGAAGFIWRDRRRFRRSEEAAQNASQ